MFVSKEYFYSDSYFEKYDYDFLLKLSNIWGNIEGSTFFSPNLDQQKLQLEFHKKCFSEINPKNILEVGTHKANFSYFVKKNFPNVKVVTFGIDPESEQCVNLVQEYFSENFIEFHCGNSLQTFSNYNTSLKFDLAWVDGGHSFDCAYSDLNNCLRLGIKNILIDDVTLLPEVKRAVIEFLDKSPNYKIIDESTDERGIIWISC
jgi:hypothetical protein